MLVPAQEDFAVDERRRGVEAVVKLVSGQHLELLTMSEDYGDAFTAGAPPRPWWTGVASMPSVVSSRLMTREQTTRALTAVLILIDLCALPAAGLSRRSPIGAGADLSRRSAGLSRRSGAKADLSRRSTEGAKAELNWPQFRGLRSGVAADDPALPETWDASHNVAWKREIPGRGWSSPVVWGDHVFVTAAINTTSADHPLKPTPSYTPRSFGGPMSGRDVARSSDPHRWVLYDVDFKTGAIRWERTLRTAVPFESKHEKNSYASETPATDGERVYVYLGNFGLFAFDMTGSPVWSKPIGPFKVRNGWWHASSPVLYRDRLYIVNDNDEQSFIAAFDTRSGDEVWRVNRDEGSNWATPFIWENEKRTEIITAGTQKVRSYDLGGKLLWTLSGMSSIDIPTPIAGDGLLFVTSGYPADRLRPAYAIRPGGEGDISLKGEETSNAFIRWSHPSLGPYNPSPLLYGGNYYTLFDRGVLACHDAKTGREVYPRQRVSADAAGFTASPWAYNGKIFALSEDGDTYVISAGADFKVLAKNPLGEMTLATPAIAHGSVIIRTASKLYRITNTPH